MRKRKTDKDYKYGFVLEEESQVFFNDLYERISLKKYFQNKKILDLACGIGAEPFALSKIAKEVIGVDIESHKEWKEFQNNKVKFQRATSSRIPFKDNSFEGAYLKDLLHHINEVEKTLDEVKRVTQNNGTIVIVEANRYNPLLYLYVTKVRGHDHFTRGEFKKQILKTFPKSEFIYLESYPPFIVSLNIYKKILKIERLVNKLKFLNPIFAYNIAIIKNFKS